MNGKDCFQHNMALLKNNPHLVQLIQNVDTSSFSFENTLSGHLNLIVDGEPIHSYDNPYSRAEQWVARQNLEGVDVLFVYGIGLGYHYDALRDWLSQSVSRYIVFLEDDPKVLRGFLTTEKATTILRDPQVYLHYLREPVKAQQLLFFAYYFSFTVIGWAEMESYAVKKKDKAKFLEDLVQSTFSRCKESFRENLLGEVFYSNFYVNTLRLPEALRGSGVFGKYHSVPAIICGAGPSLEKNIDQLVKLKDKALIFTGCTGVNVLEKKKMLPHFLGYIDPNVAQTERFQNNNSFEVSAFYYNRVHRDTLRWLHSQRLFFGGCIDSPINSYLEKEWGISEEGISGFGSILSWLLLVAKDMGCNPIIFVGMDLALTGGERYSEGVWSEYHARKNKAGFRLNRYLRKDIYGNDIYTQKAFIAERDAINNIVKKYSGINFINATEGGIGIDGIPNMPLREVAEHVLCRTIDFDNLIHADVQQLDSTSITSSEIIDTLDTLHKDFEFMDKISKEIKLSVDAESVTLGLRRAGFLEKKLQANNMYKLAIEEVLLIYDLSIKRKRKELQRDTSLTDKQRQDQYMQFYKTKMNHIDTLIRGHLVGLEKALEMGNE